MTSRVIKAECDWYCIEERSEEICITLRKGKTKLYTFEILLEQPLPSTTICNGKNVVITGPCPLWLYIATAWWAIRQDARKIGVLTRSPPIDAANQSKGTALIDVFPQAAQQSGLDWYDLKSDEDSKHIYLEVRDAQFHSVDGGWPQSIVNDIPSIFEGKDFHSVFYQGRSPVWLAAAIACAVATRDQQSQCNLIYFPPDASSSFSFPDLATLSRRSTAAPINSVRIGIVGDPNSGKTVFSYLLDAVLKSCGISPVWRFDGDASAGTPNWYIDNLIAGKEAAKDAKETRERTKRDWNHDLELDVAKGLVNLKNEIAVTIVDLPGGRFKKDAPPETGNRIPEGREVIMREIDAFIVINKPEYESYGFWREALAKHGLASRVIGKIDSCAPDSFTALSDYQLQMDGTFTGVATGMNRKAIRGTDITSFIPLAKYIQDKFGL